MSKTIAARKSGFERLGALVIPYCAAIWSSSSRSLSGGTVATSRSSSRWTWIVASLRKVAGPTSERTGSCSASSAHGPGIALAPFGTFPERHPSSRSSRPRLAVRTIRCRSPSASTTTGSSPKSRLTSCVAR